MSEQKNPVNTGRSTIGDIAEQGYGYADAYGNRFGPNEERLNALNPAEAAFPGLEVMELPSLDVLKEKSQGYNGNIRFWLPSGEVLRITVGEEGQPRDWWRQKSSDSHVVIRCDKWGNPNEKLRHLKPDTGGALATGNVGPDSGSPSAPAAPTGPVGTFYECARDSKGDALYRADTSKPMGPYRPGSTKYIATIRPGQPAVGVIAVPRLPDGQLVNLEVGRNQDSKYHGLDVRLTADNVVVGGEYLQGGEGTISFETAEHGAQLTPGKLSLPTPSLFRIEISADAETTIQMDMRNWPQPQG